MAVRSTNSPYGSNDLLVESRLGTAYPIVKAVSKALPEIIYMAQNSGKFYSWYEEVKANTVEVRELAEEVRENTETVSEAYEYFSEIYPTLLENAVEITEMYNEIKSIESRIVETTTMDFLNFEVNLDGDLLVHFAGYADASKFNINSSGELEVTL